MLVNEPIGPAQLFDLVVQRAVTSVLDLRSSGMAPQLLHSIYHRPPRVMAPQALRRLLHGSGDQVILVLTEKDQLKQMCTELLVLDAEIQIEVIE